MVGPNVSAFQNAQNFTMTGGVITTVGGNYNVYVTSDASAYNQIPPLPPLQSPSTFYTGRDTCLQVLKDCFSPKLDSKRKRFLLYGMGGIGKTQICLKFIQQYWKIWFSDIFWIDASSEHTIDLCLKQIALKYKMDAALSAESVLEWIAD
ncbi:hypothetical protein M378DRAFT_649133, partial [Amanita muscaria Koide BX008]